MKSTFQSLNEKPRRSLPVYKILLIAAAICAAVLCTKGSAYAHFSVPGITPALVKNILHCTGIDSEILCTDQESLYPCSLFIEDFKGSTVLIGFPPGGLRQGRVFFLEIDGVAASVACNSNGKLEILDGDQRLAASGILGTIQCIFTVLLTMIQDLFNAVIALDIIGILGAIVNGIINLFVCIIF